jgi:hypothetical protein
VEPNVIAIVLLVMLAGGSIALLSRQRLIPWGFPMLRASGGAIGPGKEREATEPGALVAQNAWGVDHIAAEAADEATTFPPLSTLRRDEPGWDRDLSRREVAPALPALLTQRLDTLEESLAGVQRELERQSAAIARLASEMRATADAEAARREASLANLRADLVATISALVADRQSAGRERRAEVTADLYARLARLESALSAVTNPILLPGEGFEPPTELPTEALIWENWNEVGERTFALADAYSAQRLHLSEETSAELGVFVTALRVLLTRSVYPNLQAHPDAAQQAALHAALEEIATELPKVRGALEREHRDEQPA